jgi:hypothetical protein
MTINMNIARNNKNKNENKIKKTTVVKTINSNLIRVPIRAEANR